MSPLAEALVAAQRRSLATSRPYGMKRRTRPARRALTASSGAGRRKRDPVPRLCVGCVRRGVRCEDVAAMSEDAEVTAMAEIARLLEPLDRAACSRVLAWARERYTQLHIADGDLDAFSRFNGA